MRSAYYPGVCTKPGTYYQGWFMYMRYTQGQNEEYLYYILNQVLTKQVPLYLEENTKFIQISEVQVHTIRGGSYICHVLLL